MIEWLLKDEQKAKVGRPKLADSSVLKKAGISITLCFLTCIVMGFMFVCNVKNLKPKDVLYSITIQKLEASVGTSDTFVVKQKYNSSFDYVIDITPSVKIKKYNGNYKYILYRLDGNDWKKIDEKILDKKEKSIKINVESKENKNVTYKLNLYILNAKTTKSFAPYSWKFVDSKKQEEKHTYKVFTVKGYYSPISLSEKKEAKKNKDKKITITTDKKNSRKFTINVPNGNYKLNVKYTDDEQKEIVLKNEENLKGNSSFEVPNVNKLSKVTIRVWQDSNIGKFKLSNWALKKDKLNNDYIYNTYMLKPDAKY